MTFGQRFKQLRLDKGLKQQELLDDFNNIYGYTFTKSSISQYEHDKRKPETEALKNFAQYFNVSVDYLLGISEEKIGCNPTEKLNIQKEVITAVNHFFEDDNITREEKDKLFKELSKLYFDSLQ